MTDDLLRDLGKDVPWDRPDPARRERLRASLLAEVEDEVRPTPLAKRRWLVVGGAFAAGAIAAAALALVFARDDQPLVAPAPAQITASTEARLEHRVVATPTGADEIIVVHTGTVRLATAAQRRGDRSLLRTRDAEVEGIGEYEVVVAADTLRSVSVRTGSAQIKVAGQRAVFLATGQTWRASIITTDLSPAPGRDVAPAAIAPAEIAPADPAPADPGDGRTDTGRADLARTEVHAPEEPAPTRVARHKTRTESARVDNARNESAPTDDARTEKARTESAPTQPARPEIAPTPTGPEIRASESPAPSATARKTSSVIEQRFQAGWALLKQGKAKQAAIELGAAADAAPNDPLAADARYFQAVALVRAGERVAAERVLATFLDQAPRSLRRGRAAVLLGRLLGDRGDGGAARTWLESAVADPDPAIAAAARAGLEALAAKKR